MRQQSIEIGSRFNRWEVTDGPATIRRPDGRPRDQGWWCRCECGTLRLVAKYDLVHKKTRSCGCLSRELAKARVTHAGSREALYGVWAEMGARCRRPSHPAFAYYGGRGIRVCAEWKSYATFRTWAVAHGYAEGLTIDRVDNDGNYEQGNCGWVDREAQANNTRANRWIEAFGERHTVSEWARDPRCMVTRRQLNKRLTAGWSAELALATLPEADIFVHAYGETKTLNAWAHDSRCVIGRDALRHRIVDLHWPAGRAITLPSQRGRKFEDM